MAQSVSGYEDSGVPDRLPSLFLLTQPELCRQLGKNSKKYVEDSFNSSKISKKIGKQLYTLLKPGGIGVLYAHDSYGSTKHLQKIGFKVLFGGTTLVIMKPAWKQLFKQSKVS